MYKYKILDYLQYNKYNLGMGTVIQKDAFDEIAFDGIKSASKVEALCQAEDRTDVVQDVFSALYKTRPEIDAAAPKVQRELMQQLLSMNEYQQLHASTQLDEIASAFGILQLAPNLITQMKEIQNKAEEKQKQTGQEPSLEEVLGQDGLSKLRQSLRAGMEEAQEDAENWEDIRRSFGIEQGELQQVPFEERFNLAERLKNSDKLKKITDMAGRFKNVVNSASAKVPTHGADEIVDIGQGSDISRIIPSEAVKLLKTPKLFYRDMLESKLLVYNMQGVEELGKGPIIFALDHSASMEGMRECWGKAFALAMMGLAEKQKRSFGYVAFDNRILMQKFFPRNNPPSIKDKVQIASLASTGGTNFFAPLLEAFEMRRKDPDLKPADIVFVTDGEYEWTPEQLEQVLKLKKETGVRVYGVAINDRMHGSGAMGKALESFCDQISVVNSLGEISTISDVIVKTAG